jgi:hypothetical protein
VSIYSEFNGKCRLAVDSGVTEETIKLWFQIYLWIVDKGYADIADTPEFVERIQAFRNITVPTISNCLDPSHYSLSKFGKLYLAKQFMMSLFAEKETT